MNFRAFLFCASLIASAFQPLTSAAQTVAHSPMEVQQKLLEKGYSPGVADGVWGKKSVNALKAFQRDNGLAASGIADGSVLELMFPRPPEPTANAEPKGASAVSGQIVGAAAVNPAKQIEPAQKVESPKVEIVLQRPTTPSPAPAHNADVPAGDSTKAQEGSSGNGVYVAFAIGAALLLIVFRRKKKSKLLAEEHPDSQRTEKVRGESAKTESFASIAPQPEVVRETGFRGSLRTNSENVAAFVASNSVVSKEETPVATPSPEARPVPRISQQTLHNAATWVEATGQAAIMPEGRPFFGTLRRADGEGPLGRTIKGASGPVSPSWISAEMSASVGGITVAGGLIYVGTLLPKQNASRENENCLINPKLEVGRHGDPQGQSMGYWPSYSQMSPAARRSYLDWLSGPRSDPTTYIGYVFLYLYGLERRLMLDDQAPDAERVVNEVHRLLAIYGAHNSFYRYAHELLSAYHVRSQPLSEDFIPDVDGNGYEVPTSIKIALGLRVRDGRALEPDLLLKFAISHPETRVRTPARRAPELLKLLFNEELTKLHPDGFRMKGGKFKTLKATYRACSGSFTVDVLASGGSVPDVSERAEPIATARKIFDACTEQLDEYSRALGRSPGMSPSINAVAKLPASLRPKVAEQLAGAPLAAMANLATQGVPIKLGDLLTSLDIEVGTSIGKSRLRDMSQLLSAFGFGNTADPAYALKLAVADDTVLVFRSAGEALSPSAAYRSVQLSVMLGLLVGHADGHLDATEHQALIERIDRASGLDADERLRLKSELRLIDLEPSRLDEWAKRLKDVPAAAREGLATELVAMAAADGTLHASEVKTLESLFKKMGLDQRTLYQMLHENGSSRQSSIDDNLSFVVEPDAAPSGVPIPSEPSQRKVTRIDVGRLNAIRNETRVTASVLETIFADEETVAETILIAHPAVAEESDVFEGLERRYGFLVSELATSPSWKASDFASLIRAAGLMPGAARDAINDWSMDQFDELLIEGEEPITINVFILPANLQTSTIPTIAESILA